MYWECPNKYLSKNKIWLSGKFIIFRKNQTSLHQLGNLSKYYYVFVFDTHISYLYSNQIEIVIFNLAYDWVDTDKVDNKYERIVIYLVETKELFSSFLGSVKIKINDNFIWNWNISCYLRLHLPLFSSFRSLPYPFVLIFIAFSHFRFIH